MSSLLLAELDPAPAEAVSTPCARLTVVIASLGRPILLRAALERVLRQTRPPDRLIAVVVRTADLPEDYQAPRHIHATEFVPLFSPAGLTRQRNEAINWLGASGRSGENAISAAETVVFCDDDFLMSQAWLANLERDFQEQPALIGATGVVLADGVTNGGYSEGQALSILAAKRSELPVGDWRLRPGRVKSLYGCNMAVRGSALRQIRFDEGLPAYGWLEDYDFSTRLARLGELKRLASLQGVHLGAKSGRVSGARLGYSQVANPIYLARKGSMPIGFAAKMIFKNMAANAAGCWRAAGPEDRAGRLSGNLQAVRDAFAGRINPLNIANITR